MTLPAAIGSVWSTAPILVLLYSFLLPQELRFTVVGQIIYPYRMVIFALLPWMWRRLASGQLRPSAGDWLIFLGGAWMVISFMVYYGPGVGVLRGGALALDTMGAYIITRLSIRTTDDLRRVLIAFAPGVMLAALSIAAESISHRFFVRPFFAAFFGKLPNYVNGEAAGPARDFVVYRLGLLRAPGPFSQPILAGVFLSSLIPLYYMSRIRGWPWIAGLVAGACSIFSVSSAAFLGIVLSIGLIGYDILQRRITFLSWKIFLFGLVMVGLVLEMATQHGVVSLLIRFTLDPSTGYFRTLIWHYGMISIEHHPWFGIGFTSYERLPWMVPSVDAYFLYLGIRHGFIVPVAFLLGSILLVIRLGRRASQQRFGERSVMVGTTICVVVLVSLAQTVSYFGSVGLWFYVALAMASSLGDPQSVPAFRQASDAAA